MDLVEYFSGKLSECCCPLQLFAEILLRLRGGGGDAICQQMILWPLQFLLTKVGRSVDSGLGLPRSGDLPRGFCSPTHGPTARAPTERPPHMREGRGRREQYPTAGSAQRGNPCSTEVSH